MMQWVKQEHEGTYTAPEQLSIGLRLHISAVVRKLHGSEAGMLGIDSCPPIDVPLATLGILKDCGVSVLITLRDVFVPRRYSVEWVTAILLHICEWTRRRVTDHGRNKLWRVAKSCASDP